MGPIRVNAEISSLARQRDLPSPFDQLRAQVADGLARGIDRAIRVALERRGLIADQVHPRLTREVQGGRERILLDGRLLVEFGLVKFDLSEDGLLLSATMPVREAALPEAKPERPMFLVHPAHAEHPDGLEILRGMQANGMDVRVMPNALAPAVPLDEWIKPTERVPVCVVCGAWGGVRLGRGDQKWRCQNAGCA